MKKRDFIILGILVLIVGLSFLITGLMNKKGNIANVYHKGELVREIDLTVDGEYEIIDDFIVKVENMKISVLESNCGDKTCIHMGETNSSNKPLVCAPNGIYISIPGNSKDVIVG